LGAVAVVFAVPGCIEGAKLSFRLPPDFLGPPPEGWEVPKTGEVEAEAEVAEAEADAEVEVEVPMEPTVEVGPEAPPEVPDGAEIPPKDARDAEVVPEAEVGPPCPEGTEGCPCGAGCAPPKPGEQPGGECVAYGCHPETQRCGRWLKPNGSSCSPTAPGDPCTLESRCLEGSCVAGLERFCSDDDPCTSETCDDEGNCLFEAIKVAPGAFIACDDKNPCTVDDHCEDKKGCRATPDPDLCPCGSDGDCAAYQPPGACAVLLSCQDWSQSGSSTCGLKQTGAKPPVGCNATAPVECQVPVCLPKTGGGVACYWGMPAPDGSGCQDGDPCTTGDLCQAGVCKGSPLDCQATDCLAPTACVSGQCLPSAASPQCSCETAAAACPGLPVGALACIAGKCVWDVTSLPPADCLDQAADPCKDCVKQQKGWEVVLAADGAPCPIGDGRSGTCQAGVCSAAAPCTTELLCQTVEEHPQAGCRLVPKGGPCGEGCVLGGCAFGACITFPSGGCAETAANPCETAVCNPISKACETVVSPGACTPEDKCATEGFCAPGGVCLAAKRVCDDGNPCTADTCDPATGCKLANPEDGAGSPVRPCDDGVACTWGDVCSVGVCEGGDSLCDCQDTSDCQASGFDPCLGPVTCVQNRCTQDTAGAIACSDPNPSDCTVKRCVASGGLGVCQDVPRPAGAPCDDQDRCTGADVCATVDGAWKCAGTSLVCDDANPCSETVCLKDQGCVGSPVAASCDDGNPCTGPDACKDGVCTGIQSGTCEACKADWQCSDTDQNRCNGVVKCNPTSGQCVVVDRPALCPPSLDPCAVNRCQAGNGTCLAEPIQDGTACEDGNACTQGTTCQAGVCKGGTSKVCQDQNPCTTEVCDPVSGECTKSSATGAGCKSGDCIQASACLDGACQITVKPESCSCTIDSDCPPSTVNKCLGTWECDAGGCRLLPDTEVACAYGPGESPTPCKLKTCVPSTGACAWVTLATQAECDDGDPCTIGQRCDAAGTCAGGLPVECDDHNPCTVDACDPAAGCTHTSADGAACTGPSSAGTCALGVCQETAPQSCKGAVACTASGICGVVMTCDKTDNQYLCRPVGAPVACDDSNPEDCKLWTCSPDGLACVATYQPEGQACADQNLCTAGDFCVAGGGGTTTCTGSLVSCQDQNPCTAGSCEAGLCNQTLVADGAACDDGDLLTENDVCNAGICKGIPVFQCENDPECGYIDPADKCKGLKRCVDSVCVDDPLTAVGCPAAPGPCSYYQCGAATGQCELKMKPSGQGCNDGNLCTGGNQAGATCDGLGVCRKGVEVECDGQTACQTEICLQATGTCAWVDAADGSPCDDGNLCTLEDMCHVGQCGGLPVLCGDETPCTIGRCNEADGKCLQVNLGAECLCDTAADCDEMTGGDPCAGTVTCEANLCVLTPPAPCTGGSDPCMPEICIGGLCLAEPAPLGTACDDADACTLKDRCQEQGECAGDPKSCDDREACTADSCGLDGACQHSTLAEGATCDDGDASNGADKCTAGKCVAGTKTFACQDNANCQLGAMKDDGDVCNGSYGCVKEMGATQGTCKKGGVLTCPEDPHGCLVWTCDPSVGCVADPVDEGLPCQDGDPCSFGDTCQQGDCLGVPRLCDDNHPCTLDACDPLLGICIHDTFEGACDDNNPCTVDDLCDGAGGCKGTGCDDGLPCTQNKCAAHTAGWQAGCVFPPANEGLTCEDGDPCSTQSVCTSGVCKPTESGCGGACASAATCVPTDGLYDACKGPLDCLGSFCLHDASKAVICPPKNDCTNSYCSAGACKTEALKADGQLCNDNQLCTVEDTCTQGACLGTTVDITTYCGAPTDPCRRLVCYPEYSAKVCREIDQAGACDDGNGCTLFDVCQTGTCAGGAPSLPRYDFDAGDIAEWQPTASAVTTPPASWSLSGYRSLSPPLAAYAGVPASGSTVTSAKYKVSMTMPVVTLPPGFSTATLRFAVFPDLVAPKCDKPAAGPGTCQNSQEGATCTKDTDCAAIETLKVGVNGNQAVAINAPRGQWTHQELALEGYKGAEIQGVGFTFQVVFEFAINPKGLAASRGVFVDDVEVNLTCP
jgi:hypothetical protein